MAILTAAHCVDELERRPHSIGYFECSGGLDDALESATVCPNQVDVALVTVREHAAATLLAFAHDAAMVPPANESLVSDNQWCMVAGYPAALVFEEVDRGRRVVHLRFGGVTHLTGVARVDEQGRFAVYWDEGDVEHEHPDWKRFGVSEGDRMKLPNPHGISGGALWRFTGGTPKETVWAPQTRAHLIGVASFFLPDSRLEVFEPASAWSDWFRERLSALDEP